VQPHLGPPIGTGSRIDARADRADQNSVAPVAHDRRESWWRPDRRVWSEGLAGLGIARGTKSTIARRRALFLPAASVRHQMATKSSRIAEAGAGKNPAGWASPRQHQVEQMRPRPRAPFPMTKSRQRRTHGGYPRTENMVRPAISSAIRCSLRRRFDRLGRRCLEFGNMYRRSPPICANKRP